MEITLRNFRQEFHEKFTLIFAVLKYLQSSKELLKVVDFCCKIHFESLVIHLCLAKLLSALSFFFFWLWKTKWMKYLSFQIHQWIHRKYLSFFCVLRNYNASEVPAGEASDRKKSPQAATKMHNGFDFKRHQYSSAFLSKRPLYT